MQAGSTLVEFEAETVGAYHAYQGGYTTQIGGVNFYGARVYIDANRRSQASTTRPARRA